MSHHDTNILYLWSEVTGYVHGVLRALSQQVRSIDVVYWDNRGVNSTRYETTDDGGIKYHRRSEMTVDQIFELLEKKRPSIVVVSGWMDKGYLKACRIHKKRHPSVRIVAGIDDQWMGTPRQQVGRLYYAMFYRSLFDHLWVSGSPQFSYAQRFGYNIGSIIHNLYSADTDTFDKVAVSAKRFLYVGRFVKIKAPDILLEAYGLLPEEKQRGWPLVLIGDGEMRETLSASGNPNVTILPFMQPKDLRNELLKGGVACLTSHKDQWGVVVHEYALLGLPLLLSSGVGASTQFLIPGYNGYMFDKGNIDSLYRMMLKMCNSSDEQLKKMGIHSHELGRTITNEKSASSLLSILHTTIP